MPISAMFLVAALLHLGAFVSYPESGRMGPTYLYISVLLWTMFAVLLNRAAVNSNRENKLFIAIAFSAACAFSAISFLPQKDGVSALRKFSAGQYPSKTSVYFGLRRLGIDAPGLLPPAKEEKPI